MSGFGFYADDEQPEPWPDAPPEYPCGATNEHARHTYRDRHGGMVDCDGSPLDPDEFEREAPEEGT